MTVCTCIPVAVTRPRNTPPLVCTLETSPTLHTPPPTFKEGTTERLLSCSHSMRACILPENSSFYSFFAIHMLIHFTAIIVLLYAHSLTPITIRNAHIFIYNIHVATFYLFNILLAVSWCSLRIARSIFLCKLMRRAPPSHAK